MWSPKDLISLLYVLMSLWPSDQNVPLTNFNSMTRFLRICRLNSLWVSMQEVCCPREPPTFPLSPPRADKWIQITVIEAFYRKMVIQKRRWQEKSFLNTFFDLLSYVHLPLIVWDHDPSDLSSIWAHAVCRSFYFTSLLLHSAVGHVLDDSNLSKHFVAIKSLFCFNSYCSAVPWDLCWFWQTVCGDF